MNFEDMPLALAMRNDDVSIRHSPVLVEKSALEQQWVLTQADEALVHELASTHDLDLVIARLLAARSVESDAVADYLKPTLRALMPDPYVMRDVEAAATRLGRAILSEQTVGIFGDYDVDGVTASALVYLYLQSLDIPVEVYLPDRVGDGYGPSIAAFENLRDRGADVIVTVDCGASAHEPIEAASTKGVDIVVIDHHLMGGPPPVGASAVVNPNRQDDLSGLTNLSAVGVAFMVLVAVNRWLDQQAYFADKSKPDLRQWLDIVALGLVCDVMQVQGLTRAMIAQGLQVMTRQLQTGNGGNPGLAALAKRCGVKGDASPYHLGFLIGPRINAAGRIGHANMAFKLITTRDNEERDRLCERLHVLNAERQEIETNVLEAAIRQVEEQYRQSQSETQGVIVTAGEGWHQGVVGIVAGRLKERYGRPALTIALEEKDGVLIGKGSGRSIHGVDLGSAISAARDEGVLIAGGGHAMAAGLTVAADKLADFKAFMDARLSEDIARALATKALKLDGVVSELAVTASFANLIDQAGPFGPGNAEPCFMLENMRVQYPKLVGNAHIAP